MTHSKPLPEGHYADCPNGRRIHYLDVSTKTGSDTESGHDNSAVVVFLHGSGPGASGHSNFQGNYPAWAEHGYRCIIPDLVGFGYSDKPEDVEYPLAFFVECLKQTLDAAGVKRCSLVGNSLGGAVAIGLALAHPERVEKLILMAPGGMSEREEYLQMPGMQKMFDVYFADTPINATSMRAMFEFGLVYDPQHITDELIDQRMHVMDLMNSQVMLTMDIPYLPERLPELQCPVLVFWGANDQMMPDSGILALVNNCANMKMITLSECGHWAMVEHEALFNHEGLQFLAADNTTG